MSINQMVDLTQFEQDCINCDEAAAAYHMKYGAQECMHAFALANILSSHKKPLEAACLYGLSYRLHSKEEGQFPKVSTILLLQLMCFLKAGKELPEYEMQLLSAQAPIYARYVESMHDIWRGKASSISSALQHMGNAFEEFTSGEEIDRLYLEQAQKVQPSLFVGDLAHTPTLGTIPKKMFLYWDKNPPAEIMENIYFHQGIPDLDFKVFNQDEAVEWLYRFYGKEAKALFLSMRSAAEASNFLRLHVTNLCGGWWLNTTLRLAGENALDFVLQEQSNVALFLTQDSRVHNCFYGTAPHSAFMQDCLMVLYENCFMRRNLYPEYKTGTGVLGRALSRRAYRALEGVQTRENITLYGPEQLAALVYNCNAAA